MLARGDVLGVVGEQPTTQAEKRDHAVICDAMLDARSGLSRTGVADAWVGRSTPARAALGVSRQAAEPEPMGRLNSALRGRGG